MSLDFAAPWESDALTARPERLGCILLVDIPTEQRIIEVDFIQAMLTVIIDVLTCVSDALSVCLSISRLPGSLTLLLRDQEDWDVFFWLISLWNSFDLAAHTQTHNMRS